MSHKAHVRNACLLFEYQWHCDTNVHSAGGSKSLRFIFMCPSLVLSGLYCITSPPLAINWEYCVVGPSTITFWISLRRIKWNIMCWRMTISSHVQQGSRPNSRNTLFFYIEGASIHKPQFLIASESDIRYLLVRILHFSRCETLHIEGRR